MRVLSICSSEMTSLNSSGHPAANERIFAHLVSMVRDILPHWPDAVEDHVIGQVDTVFNAPVFLRVAVRPRLAGIDHLENTRIVFQRCVFGPSRLRQQPALPSL